MSIAFQDGYKNATLTFESDKITFESTVDDGDYSPGTYDCWMDWEQPVMEKMAELAVSEGDHVLECGFGMGLLSDAIQARNPGSHTITETHPQLIEKAKAWASGKSNIILYEDEWIELLNQTGRYDVILINTYADPIIYAQRPRFVHFCRNKAAKSGCKISWYNSSGNTSDHTKFYWDNVSFTEIEVNPPSNTYYNQTKYYVPLKTLSPDPTGYGITSDAMVNISNSETRQINSIYSDLDILTCADPSNPNLVTQKSGKGRGMKCKGIYNINDGLLKATGNHPMIVKRSGSWVNKTMNELVVGDKLYKVDNTEIEITKIDFDSSDTIYEISNIVIDHNHFINNILIRKEDTDA